VHPGGVLEHVGRRVGAPELGRHHALPGLPGPFALRAGLRVARRRAAALLARLLGALLGVVAGHRVLLACRSSVTRTAYPLRAAAHVPRCAAAKTMWVGNKPSGNPCS